MGWNINAGSPDAPGEDGNYVSVSVVTLGSVVKLERVPLTATVAEVVNSVRREPLTGWSEVSLGLSRPGRREPQTLSPQQALGEAGVQHGQWNCIEMARLGRGLVCVRGSRNARGRMLDFTEAEFDVFFVGVRIGDFDG